MDGGYITTSLDNGLTWTNVIEHQGYLWANYEGFPSYNWSCHDECGLYSDSDTLFDGSYGFSGNSGGWMHTILGWHYIPCKKNAINETERQIVRFHFVSDSIDSQKEGWMIDDIHLYSLNMGSDIHSQESNNGFVLYPNPMDGFVHVESQQAISRWSLLDLQGRILRSGEAGGGAVIIEREGLYAGTYMVWVEYLEYKLVVR